MADARGLIGGTGPKRIGVVALAVFSIAVGARVSFPVPGSAVPQTAQTFVVVLVGALLGRRNGTVALLAYLLAGSVGLPVFADGASGVRHLVGPTAGYLAGFVAAAAIAGWAREVSWFDRFAGGLTAGAAAHLVILVAGALWLARTSGLEPALGTGFVPFLWGGLVKSTVAAGVVLLVTRFANRDGRVQNGIDDV